MGYAERDLIGKRLTELFPEMFLLVTEGAVRKALAGEQTSFEAVQVRQDDSAIIWNAILSPIAASAGNACRFIGVFTDITAQKQAEEALRKSEEFVRSVMDNVDEGFLVVDRDYRVVTANRVYCEWTGKRLENITGRHCYELTHRIAEPCDHRGVDCAVRRVFESGEPQTAIHKHEDARGNLLDVETRAFPMKDASGSVTSVIETIQNITARYLLEAEQLKIRKLEAVGTLAGGIAHDFNNLLQGIFGYISLAKSNLDQREKARVMIEQAEKALGMSINLTNQLLTFSRGGKPVKKKIGLLPMIENAAKFALSGSHSDYRVTFDRHLRHVEADEGQLWQVIQNIVQNAREAMPAGGIIEISAENLDIPEGEMPWLPDGGKLVRIAIRDEGVGISEQHLPMIFDPYFTTKEKGTGLGLATSYSIVRNHGGMIEAASEPGKGSVFSIFLPAAGAEADAPEGPLDPAASAVRKGRVLVMDDDEIVRTVVREMIEALGHEPQCASDGEDAIDKFLQARQAGKPFDVVVLDLTVKGGMGGEQALRELRAIDPEIKAVVSSGYADNPVMSNYRSYGFAAFLVKPYRVDELTASLNALLK